MTKKDLEQYICSQKSMTTGRLKKMLYRYKVKVKKCENCNVGEIYNNKLLVHHLHHKDGNITNNSLANLQILCPNCHSQTENFRSKKMISDSAIIAACRAANTISNVIRNLNRYPSGSLYKRIEKIIVENKIPIEKYNYKINISKNYKNKTIKIKQNEFKYCLHCKKIFVKKDTKKYCSYKCYYNAARKYNFDIKDSIEKVKQLGWCAAARELNIGGNFTDVQLRIAVKRYIKENNLNINFYDLSKYKKHSRFK